MGKKLKFNQPKKLPLPDDFVSGIKFSPTTDESYIGKNMGILAGTTPSYKLDISGQSLIKKDGHIRIIDQKLYFEPDGLEKPNRNSEKYFDYATPELSAEWINEMKEYEASKQLIEVGNKYFIKEIDPFDLYVHIANVDSFIKNNQKCKAQIINNKAIIVELTK